MIASDKNIHQKTTDQGFKKMYGICQTASERNPNNVFQIKKTTIEKFCDAGPDIVEDNFKGFRLFIIMQLR